LKGIEETSEEEGSVRDRRTVLHQMFSLACEHSPLLDNQFTHLLKKGRMGLFIAKDLRFKTALLKWVYKFKGSDLNT
jgi:hypothetical protein